jgi:cytochrome P450
MDSDNFFFSSSNVAAQKGMIMLLRYTCYSALLVAVLFLAVVATFVAYRFVRWYTCPFHKLLPGPRRGFWLGTLPETLRESYFAPQMKWWHDAGILDATFIHDTRVLGGSALWVLDKDIVKTIMVNTDRQNGRFRVGRDYIVEVSGQSVFSTEQEDWARHRRILQPAFQSGLLKETVSASVPVRVNKLIACWNRANESHAKATGGRLREIDATSHLSALALDVIGDLAFSHDFHGLDAVEEWANDDNNNNKASGGGSSAQLPNLKDEFLQAIQDLTGYDDVALIFFLLLDMVWIYTRWSPSWRRKLRLADESSARIIAHAEEQMKQQKEERAKKKALGGGSASSEASAITNPSLLQLILDAQDPDESTASCRRMLNKVEVLSEVKTISIAGFETSATTITWALFALVKHPDIQCRLADDIEKHAPSLTVQDITIHHVEKMEYLNAFFQEVLRLYSTVGQTNRKCRRNETLAGVDLPAGTRFVIPFGLLHRHPKYWDQPDLFLPERWLNMTKEEQERRRFAYMPFGAGNRDCIGKSLALLEIKLVVAAIVRAFHVQLAPSQRDTDFTFVSQVVMKMNPLLKIVVKKRGAGMLPSI